MKTANDRINDPQAIVFRATLFQERFDGLTWVGTYRNVQDAIHGAVVRTGVYQVRGIPTGRLIHRVVSARGRILKILDPIDDEIGTG